MSKDTKALIKWKTIKQTISNNLIHIGGVAVTIVIIGGALFLTMVVPRSSPKTSSFTVAEVVKIEEDLGVKIEPEVPLTYDQKWKAGAHVKVEEMDESYWYGYDPILSEDGKVLTFTSIFP